MLDLKVEKKIQTCGKFLLVLHRTPVVAKPKPLVWSEQVEVAFLINIEYFMKFVEVHLNLTGFYLRGSCTEIWEISASEL